MRALTASEQLASTRFQVGSASQQCRAVDCSAVHAWYNATGRYRRTCLACLPACLLRHSAALQPLTHNPSLHPLQLRRAPGCTELIYMYDGDKNGVCWHLGTSGGTQPWVNPVLGGQLQVGWDCWLCRAGSAGAGGATCGAATSIVSLLPAACANPRPPPLLLLPSACRCAPAALPAAAQTPRPWWATTLPAATLLGPAWRTGSCPGAFCRCLPGCPPAFLPACTK